MMTEKLVLAGTFSELLYLPEARMSIIFLRYELNYQFCDQTVTMPKFYFLRFSVMTRNFSIALDVE
jgi:hypothetical protein